MYRQIDSDNDILSNALLSFSASESISPFVLSFRKIFLNCSLMGSGLYFHWKTILLPPRIAEYVVVHEMAHLHEPHHTPQFWRRVERAMPDYELRKSLLDQRGVQVEGL